MTKRTLFLRIIMAFVLFSLLLGGARVDSVTVSGSDDSFVIVNRSEPSALPNPGPVQVSIVRTLSQGEPEILVTAEGAFESHIDAPDGRRYSQLNIPGCGATAEDIGYPAMPFKGFFLEIPYGVDASVELVDYSVSSLGTGFLIYPQQPPLPDCTKCEREYSFEITKAAYTTDAFFPATPVVIDEPGFIRGRRVVFVEVFPLQYKLNRDSHLF